MDVYRTAAVLIRQNGDSASLEAASRADALPDRGDLEGQAVWQRILSAIKDLQTPERPAEVSQH